MPSGAKHGNDTRATPLLQVWANFFSNDHWLFKNCSLGEVVELDQRPSKRPVSPNMLMQVVFMLNWDFYPKGHGLYGSVQRNFGSDFEGLVDDDEGAHSFVPEYNLQDLVDSDPFWQYGNLCGHGRQREDQNVSPQLRPVSPTYQGRRRQNYNNHLRNRCLVILFCIILVILTKIILLQQ